MRFVLIALAATIVAACSGNHPDSAPAAAPSAAPYADGRAIFMTGRDLAGHKITAVPPAMRSSCVQCHLPSGAGGVHFPESVVSADLRHKALVTDQKHPYTIALLERAISTGIDNEGLKLSPVMPRWKMSRTDLHDVADYVYHVLK